MPQGRTHLSGSLVGLALVVAAVAIPSTQATRVSAQTGFLAAALRGQQRVVHTANGDHLQASISAGTLEAAIEAQQAQAAAQAAAPNSAASAAVSPASLGINSSSLGCGSRNPNSNVRVNQDCTFRRQAEEVVKYNPANPSNLVAGQNDSRIGYNHCGVDYSLDSGAHWGDGLPPFWQKENHPEQQLPSKADPTQHTITGHKGTDRTYDFASDPMVAVDSQGRSYFGCVVISLAANEGDDPSDGATGLLVTASPAGAAGSFFNNLSAHTRRNVVVEDNDLNVFHDKPFLAADFYANSPNRDHVYATWTIFKIDPNDRFCSPPIAPFGCSPIFGSMSTNGGVTWSTPEEISGSAPFCVSPSGGTFVSGPCNQDQGSDPVVVPDGKGSLVVTFNNTNTPSTTQAQLAVRCAPSGDSAAGTAHFNCNKTPSLVGDDIQANQPLCDFGRGPEECIPGAFIRTNDFPRIAVNRDNGHLFVTWQDYRNGEFDIQVAQSTDGGATWKPRTKDQAAPVNPDSGTDHYFPAIDTASSPAGGGQQSTGNNGDDHVGVSYYRTGRVPNENTTPKGGFAPGQPGVQAEISDYALAGGRGRNTPYAFQVVSPQFAPPDGAQAGFNGDYSGLTIVNTTAHPIWSDTRNASPFPASSPDFQGVVRDEDVYTDSITLPDNGGGGHGGG